MAKRKFINIDNFWIDLQVQTPVSIAMESNIITEQDIVKPYLNKLRKQLKQDIQNGVIQISNGNEKLFAEIDNLLSEQGNTE